MKEPYVVCIGKNAVDEYYTMEHYPALGEKAVIEYAQTLPGGFIANAAAVLGSLGAECYMVDVLGTDKYTQMLLDAMRTHGVKTEYIETEEGAENYRTMILTNGSERVIFLVKPNKRAPVASERTRKLLLGARFVYSDINDLKRLENHREIIEEFTGAGAVLFLDAETSTFHSREADRFFFEKAGIISFNEFALEKYCKDTGEQALDSLLSLDSKKIILITLGKRGCRILTSSGELPVPAISVRAADTTGAGDTFNAAFVFGMLSGWDIGRSARFAAAAAARSVLSVGPRAGAVSCEEVLGFMENVRTGALILS